MELTRWRALTDPHGRRQRGSWDGLVRLLQRQRHDGSGWSPATFRDDVRRAAACEAVTATVLDYDDGATDTPAAGVLWGRCRAVIYTTRKHTVDAPRLRVVLALSRPVVPSEHALLWGWLASRTIARGHPIDQSGKDCSRLWYWPGEGGEVIECEGQPIHVDRALVRASAMHDREACARTVEPGDVEASAIDRARRYLDRIPGAVSGRGGHAQTLWVAVALVRGWGLGPDVGGALLREYNARCDPPWSERELEHKIASAVNSNRVGHGWLLRGERR